MKRVTASEARRHWFRLLDEVVAGATVVIERAGKRILLQREPGDATSGSVPDYRGLIVVPDAERASEWRWEWPGPESDLIVRDREER
jgi:hypothetical protein